MPPDFTPNQLDAIHYRQLDACVVAGPGSGKTTVLVERYRSLILDHHFDPRHILAITFTEKAAANMKAKLAELFAHDPIRLRDLESAWVSTIHGFCARLLKENAIAAGIDPRFTVLDARESEELQYSCLNSALDELVDLHRSDVLELIEALQTPLNLTNDLRNAYDGIRSAGKTIAEVRSMENPGAEVTPLEIAKALLGLLANWPATLSDAQHRSRYALRAWAENLSTADTTSLKDFVLLVNAHGIRLNSVPKSEKEALEAFRDALPHLIAAAVDLHTARFRSLIFDVLTRFDELYTERKLALGALDFNDLERRAVDLLRHNDDVRARVRAQFRQVMLDEFQDINQLQSDLIELVRSPDVFFAVGDVNQSIYGFRHAQPEIFHEYRREIDGSGKHLVKLMHNFRSRNEILRCVELLLNAKEGIDPHELVAGASFAHKSEPSIEVLKIRAADEKAEEDEPAAKEARWIAHRILSLRGTLQLGADGNTRNADFADFAVLCRNGDSMKPILDGFDRAGIPYVSGRRQSFLLSREGRDITALLHTIANPSDTVALATVLRSPLAGIADDALLRIRLLAGSLSGGLNLIAYDNANLADFAPGDPRKIQRFAQNLKRWRAEQPVMPLELLLVRVLTDCGFQWTPGTVAADNVESFLHLARTRGEHHSLPDLLTEIESLQKAINLESELSDKDQGNVVQVMTAHSAKGLEFPVAIIADMDKGTRRNSASVTFTPTGLGITWNDPAGKKKSDGIGDSWQRRNSEDLKEREKREEHRLLYVAMTRAEEHLILSYSRGKRAPQNWAKMVDTLQPSSGISILETDAEPPLLRASNADTQNEDNIPTIGRPSVTGQYDSAVNVTSLAVFADCPRKYYLQRYIGWNGRRPSNFDPEDLREEDDGNESAADLGSAVHLILAGKSGSYSAEARRLADVFLKSELGIRAASASQVEREWDFIVDVEGTLVRGTIDLWFENDGEITIVDYKTDKAVNAETYTPQLALYGLALERAFGKRPAHSWLHFLRSNTLVEVPLDYKVEGLLAELRIAQDTLRFDLNEGDHCRACQFYRSLCPAGSDTNASPAPPTDRMPSRSAAAS